MWRDYKNIEANHHRNGVGGRSFTAITFTMNDPESPYYNGRLTAIVPDDDGYKLHDVECFVIHTSEPDRCYHGDNFNSDMKEIVAAHDIRAREQLVTQIRNQLKKYVDPSVTKFKDMDEIRAVIKTGYREPITTRNPAQRFESIV